MFKTSLALIAVCLATFVIEASAQIPSASTNFQCYVFSQNMPIYGGSSISVKQCGRSKPGSTFCVATVTRSSFGTFSFTADPSDQCFTDVNECVNTTYITQSSSTFKYCCNTSLCNSLSIAQLPNISQPTNMTKPTKMCENNIPISTLKMAVPLPTNTTNVTQCYTCYNCDLSDNGYIQNCGDHNYQTTDYSAYDFGQNDTSNNYTTTTAEDYNYYQHSASFFCSYKYTFDSTGREKWSGGCENANYAYVSSSSLYYNAYLSTYNQDVACGTDLCNSPSNLQNLNGMVLCEDGYYISNGVAMPPSLQCNTFYTSDFNQNNSVTITNNTCFFNSRPTCVASITKYYDGGYSYDGSSQCSNQCLNDASVNIYASTFNLCCNRTNCNALSLLSSATKQCQNNLPIRSLRRLVVPLPNSNRTVTKCFSCANCNIRNPGSIVFCDVDMYSNSYCQYRYINLRGAEFWYGGCQNSNAPPFYSTSINDMNIVQKDFSCDTDLCNNPALYPFASTYVLCEDGFYTNQTWTTTTTRTTTTPRTTTRRSSGK